MAYREYRQNVPADKRARFDAVARELAASGDFAGMSPEAQDKVFSQLAQRYGATEGPPVSKGLTSTAGGDSVSDLGTGSTSGIMGGPGTESAIGGELVGAAKSFGKKAAVQGALGMAQGATLGQVLQGVANPVNIAGAVTGAIGKGWMESMGFSTKAQTTLGKIGFGAANMALSMVNPALGIAAGVLAKPATELAADLLDVRAAEEDRDAMEDAYGKVKGMQLNKQLMNEINLEQYRPENISKKDFGYTEAVDVVSQRYEQERQRMMDNPDANISALDKIQGDLNAAREGAAAARGQMSPETKTATQSMANRERAAEISRVERARGNLTGGGMLAGGNDYSGGVGGRGLTGLDPGTYETNRDGFGDSGGGEGGFGGGSSSGDFGDRESEPGGMGGV